MLRRTSCPSGGWPCEGYPEGGFTPCYVAPNVTASPYWTDCFDAVQTLPGFGECLVKPEKSPEEWEVWLGGTFGGDCGGALLAHLRSFRERKLFPLCAETVETRCTCGMQICEASSVWRTRTCGVGCQEGLAPLPLVLIVGGSILFSAVWWWVMCRTGGYIILGGRRRRRKAIPTSEP